MAYAVAPVVFDSSGTWTAPAGVTDIAVDAWGGGGGGVDGGFLTGNGGGGGGGYAGQSSITVVPGNAYNVTVGSGGGPGAAGGNSSFAGGTLAAGGAPGSGATGGSGGAGTYNGGRGGNGGFLQGGGGGGGSAFPNAPGGNGTNNGGAGGAGTGRGGDGNGGNGQAPGGGGGGGSVLWGGGGRGAAGRVIISYQLSDLALAMTCENLVPGQSGVLAYTITVTNAGPDAASAVSLTDTIPNGIPAGSDLTNIQYRLDGGAVLPWSGSLNLGDMPAGASHTISIHADVPGTMTAIHPNTATVSTSTNDPAANNSDTRTNTVSQHADMAVTMNCATLAPGRSGMLAYTIDVTNNGPAAASAVTLTDTIPDGIPAGTDLANVQYRLDGGALLPWSGSLNLGDMPSGEWHTILIYADVPVAMTGILPNTATVSATTSDPDPADNSTTCTNGFGPLAGIFRRGLAFYQDGATDDYVAVADDDTLDLAAGGTLEGWIYPTAFEADAAIAVKGTTAAGFAYGAGFGGGTLFSAGSSWNICFAIRETSGNRHVVAAPSPLETNRWYHVACTWSGTAPGNVTVEIYINGVRETVDTVVFSSGVQTNGEDLIVGMQTITPAVFTGEMDEIRIWDTARTESEIRDFMCRKLSDPESEVHLAGYWRFDEEAGLSCIDYSGHANTGAITGGALRVCSSAPVGDDSVHDYDASGGYSRTCAAGAESLTVHAGGGTWSAAEKSGIQIYRVNRPPDNTTGPVGKRLFSDWGYWGVFITGGTHPDYTVVYHFDESLPDISHEARLLLAFRKENCQAWKNARAELDTTGNTLTRPGMSGTEYILGAAVEPRNAVRFDGADDHVAVGDDGSLDLSDTGTLEAWIHITAYADDAGIITKGETASGTVAYSLRMGPAGNNDKVVLAVYDGGASTVMSNTPLALETWYHVAGVWDDVTDAMNIYINGVSDVTLPLPAATTARDSADALLIGTGDSLNGPWFDGMIDEVRIWNVARNEADIRNTLCRKVTPADAGFGNLAGCWRFDREPEATDADMADCVDYSANDNTGIMTGFADVIDARVCSSAPIGDASAHAYAGSPFSAVVSHSDGDSFSATATGGDWGNPFSGVHVYRVDGVPVYPPDLRESTYTTPNGMTPPAGWSSVDYYRYWGVFTTDRTAGANEPEYALVYHYSGNPMVPLDESVIGMAERNAYCDRAWMDGGAAQDLTAHTLTISGRSQNDEPGKINPEYVMGGAFAPLANHLRSFTAAVTADGRCLRVSWETAVEVDVTGYQLRRREEKEGTYTVIADSYIRQKALSDVTGAGYEYIDCDVDLGGDSVYFYQLEELNSRNPGTVYGPFGPFPEKKNGSGGGGCFISAVR